MAAYRAIFSYACVESFNWLEDTIHHPGNLQFTDPRKVIIHNKHRVISSHTNHQPEWVAVYAWFEKYTDWIHKRVRKNIRYTANDDRRLKRYLEKCLLKGYTLGSSHIYRKLVCKVSTGMAIAEGFDSKMPRIKHGSRDILGLDGWSGIWRGSRNIRPGFHGEEDIA